MNKINFILILTLCWCCFVAEAQNENDQHNLKSLMSNDVYRDYLTEQGIKVIDPVQYIDDFNRLLAEVYGGKTFKYVDDSGAEYDVLVQESGMSASLVRGDAKGIKTLVIPSEVEGLETSFPVDEIGEQAFAFYGEGIGEPMKGVERLVIPEGVIRIGQNAFDGSCDLKEVTLPSSLQNLSVSMFANCGNLKSVNLPSDSQLLMIGDYVFDKCISLKSFVIPSRVRYIGKYPWRGCVSIKGVTYQVGSDIYED